MTHWIFNGFVIQHINDHSNYSFQDIPPYKGLGRYDSWPLFYEKDDQSKSLSKQAGDKWFNYFYNGNDDKYALEAVPSLDFIREYLKICKDKQIEIRIICVESKRNMPKANILKPEALFMGFDYVTSQSFFSALYNDLLEIETPERLLPFNNLLNDNGMFNNEEDLFAYVEMRNEVIHEGYNIETHGDFCMMRVSLIENFEKLTIDDRIISLL